MSQVPVYVKIFGERDNSLNAVLGDVRREVDNTSGSVVGLGRGLATGLGTASVALGATAAAIAALGFRAVATAGQFEQFEARLQAVTRNAEKARQVFDNAVKFAAVTPFGVEGIVQASVTLTAFQQNAQKTLPAVANLAAATGQRVEDVALAMSKALSGSSEGFQSLRDVSGISAADLKRFGASLNEAGGVALSSADQIERARNALLKLVDVRFGGSIEKQAATLQGALSNAGDAVTQIGATFGKELIPLATAGATAFSTLAGKIAEAPQPLRQAAAFGGVAAAALLLAGAGALALGSAAATMVTGVVSAGLALQALNTRLALTGGIAGLASQGLQKASVAVATLNATTVAGSVTVGALARGIALAGTAAGIAGVAYVAAAGALEAWRKAEEDAGKALDNQSHAQQNNFNQWKQYRDIINGVTGPAGKLVTSNNDVAKSAADVAAALASVPTAKLVAGFEKAGITLQDAKKGLDDNASSADTVRTNLAALNASISHLGDGVQNLPVNTDLLKQMFPDQSLVPIEEAKAKVKALKTELGTLATSRFAIEGVIQAFERFQKPLQESIDRIDRLQNFLKFASQARDVATLGANFKTVSGEVARTSKEFEKLGLPTTRAALVKGLLTATGTQAKAYEKLIGLLDAQEAAQLKTLEAERAIENEKVTQIERRAAREKAAASISLDNKEAELAADIKVQQEKLAAVKGATDEEIGLTEKLNGLRKQKPSDRNAEEIIRIEDRLKVVRQAADQEIAAQQKIRDDTKGILEQRVKDAGQSLQETSREAQDRINDLRESAGGTGQKVVAAYDGVIARLDAWKQAHKDLLAQSPQLRAEFEQTRRQAEAGQRQARGQVKNENLQALKQQLSESLVDSSGVEAKLNTVRQGIATLEHSINAGLVDRKAALQEIGQLRRQELQLVKEQKAEQLRNTTTLAQNKLGDNQQELEVLKERQKLGDNVEKKITDKRREVLADRIRIIDLERDAEIQSTNNKVLAEANRSHKIKQLRQELFLDVLRQHSQSEAAEAAHQAKLDGLKNRTGGLHSPLQSIAEAFGSDTEDSSAGSLLETGTFGKSNLGLRSVFRKRGFPTPGQVNAQIDKDLPAEARTGAAPGSGAVTPASAGGGPVNISAPSTLTVNIHGGDVAEMRRVINEEFRRQEGNIRRSLQTKGSQANAPIFKGSGSW